MLEANTKAWLCCYRRIVDKDYLFTFLARAYPDDEADTTLSRMQLHRPYISDVYPNHPLGRDPNDTTPRRIPKLLPETCLDKDQYPWNVICSGSDRQLAIIIRNSLYAQYRVGAYKERLPSPASQRNQAAYEAHLLEYNMSTVTNNALQTSYP